MVTDLASSPFVDLDFYRTSNADLANLDNPALLQHLQTFGLDEGRAFSPTIDLDFYASSNTDLATLSDRLLLEHLQTFGLTEGRSFSPTIDLKFYQSNNPDLANLSYDQLLGHLEAYGLAEGRSFTPVFDLKFYRANHPDLQTAGLDNQQLYEHFIRNGLAEGRAASARFDVKYYLANNSDLASAEFSSRQALQHFVLHGMLEGRAGSGIDNTPTLNPPSNLVPTQPLIPTQTRINPDDLPAPFESPSVSNPVQVVPVPDNPTLNVPPGFTVNVFEEGLTAPRWLAVTPTGDVLVTETPENRIRLLRDTNDDGAADVSKVFAGPQNGLNRPFGMAFSSGYFFVGNTNAVLRFPYTNGQEQLSGTGEKIADLPAGGHWTRNVAISPDGQKLYVSIGSQSNVEEEPLPRASVQVMNLDGSDRQTFASGLRNPVGLDFNPITGQLYTTVNERDGLGDDLVPDYLTGLSQDDFYGWPYAYLTPARLDPRRTEQGRSEVPDLADLTQMPDVLFQAHSAPLGLQFYDRQTFPEPYRNGAFVAFRGSWNRDRRTGYKLVFAPFDSAGRPQGDYQDFLTGFSTDPSQSTTWGRPTGLQVHPDGSLLFAEEGNGRIYRIQYSA